MEENSPALELPGFRFHPTEEELVHFYLRNILLHGHNPRYHVIRFLDIYRHDPSELPGLGEREWYFFVPRDRKQGSRGRPNRTTLHGFWKATGSDRKIVSVSGEQKRVIGLRKTLVFYRGRAPRGKKTDWVMNEYRLPDHSNSLPKDVVLCKMYKKATSLKFLEQRAALEEAIMVSNQSSSSSQSPPPPLSPMDTSGGNDNRSILKREEGEHAHVQTNGGPSKLLLPSGREAFPEIQATRDAFGDWTQDSIWDHFDSSPWLPSLIATPYASALNFLS